MKTQTMMAVPMSEALLWRTGHSKFEVCLTKRRSTEGRGGSDQRRGFHQNLFKFLVRLSVAKGPTAAKRSNEEQNLFKFLVRLAARTS
jgi:hypothetical protein